MGVFAWLLGRGGPKPEGTTTEEASTAGTQGDEREAGSATGAVTVAEVETGVPGSAEAEAGVETGAGAGARAETGGGEPEAGVPSASGDSAADAVEIPRQQSAEKVAGREVASGEVGETARQ